MLCRQKLALLTWIDGIVPAAERESVEFPEPYIVMLSQRAALFSGSFILPFFFFRMCRVSVPVSLIYFGPPDIQIDHIARDLETLDTRNEFNG